MRRATSMREMARNKNNKEFANFMGEDNNPNYLGYGAGAAGVAGLGAAGRYGFAEARTRRNANRVGREILESSGREIDPRTLNKAFGGGARGAAQRDLEGIKNRFGNARQAVSNQFGQARNAAANPLQTAKNAGQSVRNQFGNARQGVSQDIGNVGTNYQTSRNLGRGRVKAGLNSGRRFLGTNTGKAGLLGTALLGGGLAYNQFRD